MNKTRHINKEIILKELIKGWAIYLFMYNDNPSYRNEEFDVYETFWKMFNEDKWFIELRKNRIQMDERLIANIFVAALNETMDLYENQFIDVSLPVIPKDENEDVEVPEYPWEDLLEPSVWEFKDISDIPIDEDNLWCNETHWLDSMDSMQDESEDEIEKWNI